ncbi:MAG: hypothetical protein HQK49_19045 [Oligoflexia bacterium]|nr:hypothetical protein [Oligoflexia bacterium]
MLKAGILSPDGFKVGDDGTPQGSIVSPILSNIFSHYAIDIWIRGEMNKITNGNIYAIKYADDIVIWTDKKSAPKVIEMLKKRMERFSLTINEDKTKNISFSIRDSYRGIKQSTFNFLGFTFYLGKSRKDKWIVKLKTAKKVFTKKLREFKEWCRSNRSRSRLKHLWETFKSKMRGHINYYGVSHNYESVSKFVYQATHTFIKWLNRRSQRKTFNWDKFKLYEKTNPLPQVKIAHRLF